MGISSIKSLSENATLGLWKMTESWREMKDMLQLTENDELLFGQKKTDIRKQEWLACRVLLKTMTRQNSEIRYHENGKPFVAGDDQFISMSHSGDYVSVYLDKKKPAGVDIQKLKPSISKGAGYFLNESEQKWADLEDNILLHTIWSAKESVFKYAGDTDLDLKKHMITNSFSGNQKGFIEVNLILANHTEIVRVQYDHFDDYVFTWTI